MMTGVMNKQLIIVNQETVAAFIDGDLKAYELIYNDTKSFVYSTIFKMVNDKQKAEDLMQDVFIRIFEKRKKFNNQSSIKTWIYRIAINYTLNDIKKNRRFLNKIFKYEFFSYVANDDCEDQERLKKEKDIGIINVLLDKINPDYKICLLLKENEKMSYEEIASILGINIGTVRSRINRAKIKLINLYRKEVSYDEQ